MNIKNKLMNILTTRQLRMVTDSLSLVQAKYLEKLCVRVDSSRDLARLKNAMGAVLTESQLRRLTDSLTFSQQDYLANIIVRDFRDSRSRRLPSRLNRRGGRGILNRIDRRRRAIDRLRKGRLNRLSRSKNDVLPVEELEAAGEFIANLDDDQKLYNWGGAYYVTDVKSVQGPFSAEEVKRYYNYDVNQVLNRRDRRRRAIDMIHRRNSEKEMEEAEDAEEVREKAEEAEESAEEVSELAAEIEEEEEEDVIEDQENDMEMNMEEEDLLRENRGHRRNRKPRGNRRFNRSKSLDNSIAKMTKGFDEYSKKVNREDSNNPKEYLNAQRRLHSRLWRLSQDQFNKLAQERSLKNVMEDLK